MHFGALDGDNAASLFEDVADLFEAAAADGTPIRDIVGDDPWSSSRHLCATTTGAGTSPANVKG